MDNYPFEEGIVLRNFALEKGLDLQIVLTFSHTIHQNIHTFGVHCMYLVLTQLVNYVSSDPAMTLLLF